MSWLRIYFLKAIKATAFSSDVQHTELWLGTFLSHYAVDLSKDSGFTQGSLIKQVLEMEWLDAACSNNYG